MIPINRENVRDVIIAVLCIAAACGLFYLAGCGKPAPASPAYATAPRPGECVYLNEKTNSYEWSECKPGDDQSIPSVGKPGDWQLSSDQPNMPVPGVVNEIAQPLKEPQPIYGGKVKLEGQSNAIEGITQLGGYPMGEQNPSIDHPRYVDKGPTGQTVTGICPDGKTVAWMILTGVDAQGNATIGWMCNNREIEPVPQKWRYVDQKRYGYQEWEQKSSH